MDFDGTTVMTGSHLHLLCIIRPAGVLSNNLSKTVNRRVKEMIWAYFNTCTGEPTTCQLYSLKLLKSQL